MRIRIIICVCVSQRQKCQNILRLWNWYFPLNFQPIFFSNWNSLVSASFHLPFIIARITFIEYSCDLVAPFSKIISLISHYHLHYPNFITHFFRYCYFSISFYFFVYILSSTWKWAWSLTVFLSIPPILPIAFSS